jgi:thymidylate synthase (FAD)
MNDFPDKTPEDELFPPISRPHVDSMDKLLGKPQFVLDHGFVRLIDYMGDQSAVVQAARVSYGAGTKTPSSDRGLLRYLMRHWHTTPFEMCEIKLHVKLPVFVARQWIRHRTASVNEYSARYSILKGEFHLPDVADLARQSKTNAQGRSEPYGEDEARVIRRDMSLAYDAAFATYEDFTDEHGNDLARETAREVLPLSTYTEWYWKVNLHNLMHFLRLRADPHAQMEIRVYADVICKMMQRWVPDIYEAFEDYRLHAHTFSRQEMEVLKAYLSELYAYADEVGPVSTPPVILPGKGLSEREDLAFRKALGAEAWV